METSGSFSVSRNFLHHAAQNSSTFVLNSPLVVSLKYNKMRSLSRGKVSDWANACLKSPFVFVLWDAGNVITVTFADHRGTLKSCLWAKLAHLRFWAAIVTVWQLPAKCPTCRLEPISNGCQIDILVTIAFFRPLNLIPLKLPHAVEEQLHGQLTCTFPFTKEKKGSLASLYTLPTFASHPIDVKPAWALSTLFCHQPDISLVTQMWISDNVNPDWSFWDPCVSVCIDRLQQGLPVGIRNSQNGEV